MTKNELLSTSFLIVGLLLVAGCCFVFYGAAYFGNPVSEYIVNYRGVVATAILSIIAGRLMARENRIGWIIGMSISMEAVLETIISAFSHRNDESLVPIVAVTVVLLLIFLTLIVVLLAREIRIRYRVNLFVWGVVIAFTTMLILL